MKTLAVCVLAATAVPTATAFVPHSSPWPKIKGERMPIPTGRRQDSSCALASSAADEMARRLAMGAEFCSGKVTEATTTASPTAVAEPKEQEQKEKEEEEEPSTATATPVATAVDSDDLLARRLAMGPEFTLDQMMDEPVVVPPPLPVSTEKDEQDEELSAATSNEMTDEGLLEKRLAMGADFSFDA